jgi:hypothetical protein
LLNDIAQADGVERDNAIFDSEAAAAATDLPQVL